MALFVFALPFLALCYAASGISKLKEKGRRHKVSIGIAAASMALCLLLTAAAMEDRGAFRDVFHTGTAGMITAAYLMFLLPMASFGCIFAPSHPVNGRRDRAMRVVSFLATGGWILLSFVAVLLQVRC